MKNERNNLSNEQICKVSQYLVIHGEQVKKEQPSIDDCAAAVSKAVGFPVSILRRIGTALGET